MNKRLIALVIIVLVAISLAGCGSSEPPKQTEKPAVPAKPAAGVLDVPANNTEISGNQVQVMGWFLDNEGIAKLEVLVDDKVVGTANAGYPRSGLKEAVPGYTDYDKAGYLYVLDSTKLSNGKHTIIVKETSNSGKTAATRSATVIVKN